MFVEKYFYWHGVKESFLFYRLFCLRSRPWILSDNLYSSKIYHRIFLDYRILVLGIFWVSFAWGSRDFLLVFIFDYIRSFTSSHPCHAPVFLAVYPPGFWALGLLGVSGASQCTRILVEDLLPLAHPGYQRGLVFLVTVCTAYFFPMVRKVSSVFSFFLFLSCFFFLSLPCVFRAFRWRVGVMYFWCMTKNFLKKFWTSEPRTPKMTMLTSTFT